MKSMFDYTIHCTPDQTKKALELGAPLETCDWRITDTSRYIELDNEKGWHIQIPTAEEMIGWLEERGLIEGITIGYAEGIEWFFDVNNLSEPFISTLNFNSREEATLAAIDAAMEYLTNNKK